MSRHPSIAVPLLLVAALAAAGCREHPSPYAVKAAVERQFPGAELRLETHLRLGRVTLGLARRILRWTGELDGDARFLRHVRRVEVAEYRIEAMPEGASFGSHALAAARRMERRGWETMVRTAETDEQAWVLLKPGRDGTLEHLFVVALESDELVVVGIEGSIDRLVAEAVADEPRAFASLLGEARGASPSDPGLQLEDDREAASVAKELEPAGSGPAQ